MNSLSPPPHGAHWLAEVATALDQASELMPVLRDLRRNRAEASALSNEIDALRGEVDMMRTQHRPQAAEFHPNWIS